MRCFPPAASPVRKASKKGRNTAIIFQAASENLLPFFFKQGLQKRERWATLWVILNFKSFFMEEQANKTDNQQQANWKEQAEEKLSELKGKAEELMHIAEEKFEELKDKSEEKLDALKEKAEDVMDDLKEKASGLWEKVKDKFAGDDDKAASGS